MIRHLQPLGLFTVSTALSLALFDLNPVQAAFFEFTMGYDGSNYGALDFDLSPLKGIGTETISFNQLYQYWNDYNGSGVFAPPDFYYSYSTYLSFSDSPEVNFSGSGENAIFTFNSGELVGIEYDNPNRESFGSYDGRYGDIYVTDGLASFSFEGAETSVFLSYTTEVYELVSVEIYDENGEVIDYELQEQLVNTRSGTSVESAPINFQTIEPIEVVPEPQPIEAVPEPQPLTMLGAGTALGFGAFFKRKFSKK